MNPAERAPHAHRTEIYRFLERVNRWNLESRKGPYWVRVESVSVRGACPHRHPTPRSKEPGAWKALRSVVSSES
jgi:hypothetical protein